MPKLLLQGVALLCVFAGGAGVHKAYAAHHHPIKHTWECQIVSVNGGSFWFVRPNRELFEAYFDNPPKIFGPGTQLRDLAYTDDNAWMRHFVKAQLK